MDRIGWKDEPSTDTPIDSGNLKQMENNAENFVNKKVDGTVVYENSNGISSGTVTLSTSISDTKKIGIVFEEENGVEGFKEVENPVRENSKFTN